MNVESQTTYTEKERQSQKEEAIIRALKLDKPGALIRDGLEVYILRADGQKQFVTEATNYDRLWYETFNAIEDIRMTELMNEMMRKINQNALESYEDWVNRKMKGA